MPDQQPAPLISAAEQVSEAIEAHARVTLNHPEDVRNILQAGSALRDAVLRYEARLMGDTGWSNPIRHLGRLSMYSDGDQGGVPGGVAPESPRIEVSAKYVVGIPDEELLFNLVESRGGDRPSTAEDAVRYLFESDSWDIRQYPPSRVQFINVDVHVSASI